MECLSRPFHSRKLSNASSFSGKNAYDGVFSGHRHNYAGASPIDVQNYREIFGSSQANSSIPVLDISNLGELTDDLCLKFRSSKPDYSKIFGGFCDEDVAVSYEELFARDKARSPSSPSPSPSSTPTPQDSDNLLHQSSDDLKQFNMSYNKINQKNQDGLDVTTHVTQLHETPGSICFIDEQVPPPKMEAEKHKSFSEDKFIKTFDIDLNIHPSASPTNVIIHKHSPKRSTDKNSESCKTDASESGPRGFSYLDEGLDVNSAAFALKKAIEKAQESIRIAKESVGRKKKGLKSFSTKTSKNSLKVEDRKMENEEHNCKDEVRGVYERGTVSSQSFPDFTDGEKLFVAKKVIDEINGKISESSKDKFKDNTIVFSSTQATGDTESTSLDSTGKVENADQTNNIFVDEYEGKIEVTEQIEVDMFRESIENKDEKKVYEGSNQNDNDKRLDASLLENKKHEFLEQEDIENAENSEMNVNKNDDEASDKGIESENESKDEHFTEIHKEEETSEIIYNVCEVETEESVKTCDNIIQESEVTLHDDREMKQEDNHTYERKEESLDHEFDENLSSDYNSMEETDSIDNINVESNIVTDTHYCSKVDINMETIQELCEKTSIDQTTSDDNEDECKVKSDNPADLDSSDTGFEPTESEDNDVQSESSSGTNEIKASQEPQTEKTMEVNEEIKTSQFKEKEDENRENGPNKVERKEDLRKIDELTAKEKEAVKNRLAVDRVIREARERAFVEARERAERAAVEKATNEVRKRMMAEAREKVAKASERSYAESKLRAERAAVERATSEARQRALEKAMSQKSVSESSSSSGLHSSSGTISESALRSKAKLDKHNRIMERAAKALAEKEKRDLLSQKEQAERNRLAENLDADIKRWSKGKEGNLRALLSTLQYILGPQSGWQAVSLTEIMTTSAVKKAYRKATLCVHPDKLQQRGASIQHKYICEKVFDLLKAAWTRFNSEER